MPYVQLISGEKFEVSDSLSLLDAAIASGLSFPYSCKTGRCSSCKCKVISGETLLLTAELGLDDADKADGWVLGCARAAKTDLVLDVDIFEEPLPPIKTYVCRIKSLEKIAPDVVKVVLRLPPSSTFRFIPGQYVDVIGPGGVRRSYSLANSPRTDQTLELHIRAVASGAMSDYWFDKARANDLLRLNGPLGTFFMRNIALRDLIFLATGTGIAPVKAMLEALPDMSSDKKPKSVTVLWGGRNEQDLYFDLESLPGTFQYIPVLSRSATWRGERGYIQNVLIRSKSNFHDSTVYACGSEAMIESAKDALTAAGLPTKQFHSDAFVCSSAIES